jgi:hypothetical protein
VVSGRGLRWFAGMVLITPAPALLRFMRPRATLDRCEARGEPAPQLGERYLAPKDAECVDVEFDGHEAQLEPDGTGLFCREKNEHLAVKRPECAPSVSERVEQGRWLVGFVVLG